MKINPRPPRFACFSAYLIAHACLLFLFFGNAAAVTLPTTETPYGWWQNGPPEVQTRYVLGVDKISPIGSSRSVYVKTVLPVEKGHSGLLQKCSAENYRGKRIRFKGAVKVEGAVQGAYLWLRVDDDSKKPLQRDQMEGRAVKGTADWHDYAVVLDVPAEGTVLAYGVGLRGTGAAWFSELQLEEVGADIPSSNNLVAALAQPPKPVASRVPPCPTNLDFNAPSADYAAPATEDAPTGWMRIGTSTVSKEYVIAVDRDVVSETGASSLAIRTAGPVAVADGFGGVMQKCVADPFRGKRIRLSALVKVEDVVKGAHLWMRVDDANEKPLNRDHMIERPITTAGAWIPYSVTLDVPQESAVIAYGMFLTQSGRAWFSKLRLEEVSLDVPSTDSLPEKYKAPTSPLRKCPENMNFHNTSRNPG